MIDIGYAGALAGGALTLLSPCSAVLLPGFFAYAFNSTRKLTTRTLLFYAGLVTTLVPLGVAASSLGMLLNRYRDATILVLGIVVIVLGLMQLLGIAIRLPSRDGQSTRDAAAPLSVYLLGMGYGIAGVCSGPILGSVLAMAAMGSDPIYGGLLLMIYALGMTVPILILALLWDRFRLSRRRWLRPHGITIGPVHTTTSNLIAGALFIGIGILMIVTGGTTDLAGVLSINSQYALESRVESWSAGIPDLTVIALVVILALGATAIALRRRRSSDADDPESPASDNG